MKNKIHIITPLLIALMILTIACGGQQTEAPVLDEPMAPAEEQAPEPMEPVEEEAAPVEEAAPAEEVAMVTEADLDAAYQTFLAGMVKYNTIGLDGLNELLVESPPYLLDVRSPEEVEEKGYIEGTTLIPLRELGFDLDALPGFDETIVSYCGSGWRCTIALTALGAMGWEDVRGLKGGSFGGWVEAGYPFV